MVGGTTDLFLGDPLFRPFGAVGKARVYMENRKTVLRWVGAAIAAICATIIGATSGAYADETCGLMEAQTFQSAITHPQEEADPAYYLRTAEAFIAECPHRLEVRDAHLIAARGALDSGKARRAIKHYDGAQEIGVRLTPEQSMDYAVALMAVGSEGRATAIRRSAIAAWAAHLTQTGLGDLDIQTVEGGTIYSAAFDAIDPNKKIKAVWIADPSGAGLPAAIVLKHAPKRAAWKALRHGRAAPQPLMAADIHRCRTSEKLMESVLPLTVQEVSLAAQDALVSYLSNADGLEDTAPGKPLSSCLTLPIMLHVPDPLTAVYPGQ